MAQRLALLEARSALTEAVAPDADLSGTILDVLLINEGWGSSGYYPGDVLKASVSLFAPGTHMYVDHPSASERGDRPERTIRDLAGVIHESGYWDEEHRGIRAKVRVYSGYREFISEARDDIGLSIRGYGDFTIGEAEGKRGRVFTRLTAIESVDYVTRAGRGGKVLAILESHRPASEATVTDTRRGLYDAILSVHGAEDAYVWVRDFDPDEGKVWFDVETPDTLVIYQQDYTAEDGVVTLTGDPVEVRPTTTYVPVAAGGGATPEAPTAEGDTEESTPKREGPKMPEISEARLAELEAAAAAVESANAERDEARAALAARENHTKATEAAKPVIAAAFEGSTLPEAVTADLAESLTSGVTLNDDGTLNADALKEAATKARATAEAHAAIVAESLGAGRPRFVGYTTQTSESTADDTAATVESLDKTTAHIFGARPSTREA